MSGTNNLNLQIRIGGWLKKTKNDPLEHISYSIRGLKYVKATDISIEASLKGPH